jgi:CspA family cold shock protein
MQGVVKVYDPETGIGVIRRDGEGDEVMLRPGSLEGSLFRMLRQGQRIVFDTSEEDGDLIASNIRFGADGR